MIIFFFFTISVRLSRVDGSSNSTSSSTSSFSRLSLSSSQTPSLCRFASESHRGPSLEKLRSVCISVQETEPLDFYQMIHIQSLLDVMKHMICSSCHQMWNGSLSVKKKEGKKSPQVFQMISFSL